MNSQVSPVGPREGAALFPAVRKVNGKAVFVDAMIWDIGNVLARFDHMKACRGLAKWSDLSAEEIHERIFKLNHKLIENHMTGLVRSDKFFAEICHIASIRHPFNFEDFIYIWRDIFTENPGISELIGRLRADIRRCILTDSEPIHWAVVELLPVMKKYFGHPKMIVRSYDVVACKPAESMYREALARLRIPKGQESRVLYVDDRADCCAAFRSMGGKALRYDCSREPISRLEQGLKSFGVLRS